VIGGKVWERGHSLGILVSGHQDQGEVQALNLEC
jgi:hypothetical protein